MRKARSCHPRSRRREVGRVCDPPFRAEGIRERVEDPPYRSRPIASLAIFALAAATAAFALEPNEWRHRQSLTLEQTGLVKFALPPATLDLARPNLEDLRLLDAEGREVPYALERAAPSTPSTIRAPRAFRVSLEPAHTRILIETGDALPLAAVMLATPAQNFLKAARIELSDDGEQWTTLATGIPLFRQFGAEQLRVDLGRRAASHVRITLDDTRSRPVPFTDATLYFVTTAQPPFTTPLPVRISQREEFAGETVLTLDLGGKHVALASLEFATPDPLFARNVTIAIREVRENAAVERTLGAGSIYRVAADGLVPAANLEVPLDFVSPARELLVHIANHDSPPLAIDSVTAEQRPIWLVFRAAAPGTFTLLTGNADVDAPRYDLASLAASLRDTAPSAISPGPPQANPGYRRADPLADTPLLGAALDPAPWSYRKAMHFAAAGVHEVELDPDVLARAQANFSDLRILRDRTQIPYLIERREVERTIDVRVTARDDPQHPRLSRWDIALPRAGLPIARLTLTSSTALFMRRLRVFEKIEDSRGATYERHLGEIVWSKAPGAGHDRVVFPLVARPTTSTLTIETDNGDNPPIALAAQAQYPVVRLLFKADTAPSPGKESPLALYYGNPRAAAPRYDLSLVANQILAADKHPATLLEEERVDARAWSSALAGARGGPIFWGVLALVVIVLLVVVAKLLPKPNG